MVRERLDSQSHACVQKCATCWDAPNLFPVLSKSSEGGAAIFDMYSLFICVLCAGWSEQPTEDQLEEVRIRIA